MGGKGLILCGNVGFVKGKLGGLEGLYFSQLWLTYRQMHDLCLHTSVGIDRFR